MNTIGKKIKIKLFGTSHGPEIGAVVLGLPKGLKLN
jgi:chorismate synthase